MCFTKTRKKDKAVIANRDITVYKALNGYLEFLMSPYYSGGRYWKVKEELEEKGFVEESNAKFLSYGFHSCKTIRSARLHGDHVYEFIIPKGTLYYENRSEYISNKIYLNLEIPIN